MSQMHSKNNKEKLAYKDDDCYGFACSNKATESHIISAGIFGQVELHLCVTCQRKFVEETKDENSTHQSSSEEIHIRRQPLATSFQLPSNAINVEEYSTSNLVQRGGLSVNGSSK